MHSVTDRGASGGLREGVCYSIVDGEDFAVAKVLKLEPEIVHVRIYKEHFPARPVDIDPSRLTLGTIHDPDGFGMGHLPLRLETFLSREPAFLAESPVTASELRGYDAWKAADGGVWE